MADIWENMAKILYQYYTSDIWENASDIWENEEI
jgi:hypothetical protein